MICDISICLLDSFVYAHAILQQHCACNSKHSSACHSHHMPVSACLSLFLTAWTDPCLSAALAWARVCWENSPRTFTNYKPIPARTWEPGRRARSGVFLSHMKTMAAHTTEPFLACAFLLFVWVYICLFIQLFPFTRLLHTCDLSYFKETSLL